MRVMVCQSQGSAISIKSACLISMSKVTPDWCYRVFAIQRTRPENVFLSLLFLRLAKEPMRCNGTEKIHALNPMTTTRDPDR